MMLRIGKWFPGGTALGLLLMVCGSSGPAVAQGVVVGWGEDVFGEATAPTGLSGVIAISEGGDYSLALKNDGTVVAWGYNDFGEATVPAGLSGVIAIAAGSYFSLALKNDGTVVAWGENNSGQATVPAGLSGVVAIAASYEHSLALKSDGTVVAWGSNHQGETTVPAGLSGVVAIAAGWFHNLALKNDGTVVAWGGNLSGQATVPAGLSGVIAIASGAAHSLALRSDGTVVAWGANYSFDKYGQATVPAGLCGVVAISAGWYYSLALKNDGTVVGWGLNNYGQTTVPEGLSGVIAISAGANDSLALQSGKGFPVAHCALVTVPAGPACTAAASIDAGSYDPDGNPITLSQIPAGPYWLGLTLVTLKVMDNKGASTTCQATVTVDDVTAPTLTVPATVTVNATSPAGATVTNALLGAAATDNCPAVKLTRIPAGDMFPIGVTTVHWTARDAATNSSTATQTVTVQSDNKWPTVKCTGCYFPIAGARATLAFNVAAVGSTSTFSYNYRTLTRNIQFASTTASGVSVSGNTASFIGQGKLNGQTGYSFAVTARDGGSVGSGLDTVSISITGPGNYSYSVNGTIVGGDIVVKQ